MDQAKKQKRELQKRLGRRITLEGLESNLALCVADPARLETTLADIGGLDDIADSLVRPTGVTYVPPRAAIGPYLFTCL